jgi:BirA family transcriptional regulator, biotin operon repressor / biotin---[acetyl-CoA-carboxylase] ligase
MIVRLQTTVSTMIDAAALAARGEPHGTVVVAEEQTGGIGRHGHSWHSPGSGLYISMILRLSVSPDAMPILTMALGLAVQTAIDDLAGVSCDIRWPNDVMLNEKKLAGIMVQSADRGALIAGIGLNVNQVTFPEDIREIATSLQIETGREHSKEALLNRITAESLRYSGIAKTEILRQFAEHSTYVYGKPVEVDSKIRGVTAGLDENGFLLVATETGVERIIAGGVRPL